MFHSTDFLERIITLEGQQYKLEYDLKNVMPGSVTAFGNIYINPDEPMEFTFFTINNKIAGYTPMNGTKEFIGNIVSTVTGQALPFEE